MEYLISHLLTNVLGPQLLPRAPWDPARGNVVPPMKTAQKRSAERYEIAGGGQPCLQPRLWEHDGHRPDDGPDLEQRACRRRGAARVPAGLIRHPDALQLVDQLADRLDVL